MGNTCGCACKKGTKGIDQTEHYVANPAEQDGCQNLPGILDMSGRSSMLSVMRGSFNDHYRLGAFLGNDALSELRLCTNMMPIPDENGHPMNIRKRFVAKIVAKSKLNRLERQFFQVELSVLKQLRHPGISHVKEIFEDERNYFIVTEYHENSMSLLDYIESRGAALSDGEASRIIQQILEVIQFCHSQGIVLRNLNPDSLLMVPSMDQTWPRLKVCDILTSVEFHKNREFVTNNIALKDKDVQFLAPEILNGQQQITDQRCDLWSVGIITVLILTCQLPFSGENEEALIENMVTNTKDFSEENWNSMLSQNQRDLVDKFLRSNCKKRIQAKQAIEHEWFLQTTSSETDEAQSPVDQTPAHTKSELLYKYNTLGLLKKAVLTALIQNKMMTREQSQLEQRLAKPDYNGLEGQEIKCYEVMSVMIDLYGVNYAVQECKQVFDLFGVSREEVINLSEFAETWLSKHEILLENTTKTLFTRLDRHSKGEIDLQKILDEIIGTEDAGESGGWWIRELITIICQGVATVDLEEFQEMFLEACNKVNSNTSSTGEGGQLERKEGLDKKKLMRRGSQLDEPKFKRQFIKPKQGEDLELLARNQGSDKPVETPLKNESAEAALIATTISTNSEKDAKQSFTTYKIVGNDVIIRKTGESYRVDSFVEKDVYTPQDRTMNQQLQFEPQMKYLNEKGGLTQVEEGAMEPSSDERCETAPRSLSD